MTTIRRIATTTAQTLLAVALVATLAVAITPASSPAHAATVASFARYAKKTAAERPGPLIKVVAPGTVVTQAQWGEGVIRITTRICGTARNWQGVAAANNIRPSQYLVIYQQNVTVTCAAGSSTPPVQQPAVQPPAPAPAPVAQAASGWAHPVPGACARSGSYLQQRNGYRHQGSDLAARSGTPLYAVAAGTITSAGYHGNAGNQIILQINGATVKYNHLSSFRRTGGQVAAGEVIGYVGSTGNSTGPHLHIEFWVGGSHTDPVRFLGERGIRIGC